MMDWKRFAEATQELGGRSIDDPTQLAFSLYAAARDAFPINEVPSDVAALLAQVSSEAEALEGTMGNLAKLVARHYAAKGLGPDGEPMPECRHGKTILSEDMKSKVCQQCAAVRPLTEAELLDMASSHRVDPSEL